MQILLLESLEAAAHERLLWLETAQSLLHLAASVLAQVPKSPNADALKRKSCWWLTDANLAVGIS